MEKKCLISLTCSIPTDVSVLIMVVSVELSSNGCMSELTKSFRRSSGDFWLVMKMMDWRVID